jgi:hypothetical protein
MLVSFGLGIVAGYFIGQYKEQKKAFEARYKRGFIPTAYNDIN